MNREQLDESAATLADKAFVFGYPLVLMDLTRRKAPLNQFVHRGAFPEPSDTDVVSPNADTLYSTAWLDLGREPMILGVPELGSRYYLMQLLDAWTNVFAAPGTRTTGNSQGRFAIVGPGWRDALPEGVRELRAPTNLVWLIGSTQTNGPDDLAAVRAIQQKYTLTPLSTFGAGGPRPPRDGRLEPAVESKTTPPTQVARLEAGEVFHRLN
jgi:hypothetical protein